MEKPRYALVAYVKHSAGEFVENLRRELHPELPHMAAHLTILPPRPLQNTEQAALQTLERICGEHEPFHVTLGEVETFIPVTSTVFIRIAVGAELMTGLHTKLSTEALPFAEQLPYIPHLTIAKMSSEPLAQSAFTIAQQRWNNYSGNRKLLLDNLSFVREDAQNCWIDLAPVRLGSRLVSR
jgi:2'-5' RNA ligase